MKRRIPRRAVRPPVLLTAVALCVPMPAHAVSTHARHHDGGDAALVTLDADVVSEPTGLGASFRVTSDDPPVTDSIRRMVADHARTMGDVAPWRFEPERIEGGVEVTVTGVDVATASVIRALGFHGLMADGDYHRAHHRMLATGTDAH